MHDQPVLPLALSLRRTSEAIGPDWPLPMQYLGSKKRIATQLVAAMRRHLPHTTALVDLFGGTGAVSMAALDQRYLVHANDVQPYSTAVLRSLLSAPREGLRDAAWAVAGLRDEGVMAARDRRHMRGLLEEEDAHLDALERGGDWRDYAGFSEATPLPEGRGKEVERMQRRRPWALFCTLYPNTYFGIRQCLQIDALAELAASLPEAPRAHVVAATLAALTYAVSSTTHLAQFLKPTSARAVAALAKRRRVDVVERVLASLDALASAPAPRNVGQILGLDFAEALDALPLDRDTVVYADPPYFKEHYSRYYHVLDTFCLYDWPQLTFNPRTGRTTEGRYREGRIQSPFGRRAKVKGAFTALFDRCHAAGTTVAISYADTSLVSREDLEELAAERGYGVEVEGFRLLHSGQGQPRNREVEEQIFLLSPHPRAAARLGRLRQRLAEAAPQHDTPPGLVHPWWARKPLNLVSAVVECLTDPGGTVLDPFLGSGTTTFAASAAGRPSVGSDLSPLAVHLAGAVLHLGREPEASLALLEALVDEVAEAALPWFAAGDGWYAERVRYQVEGDYAHGAFTLTPTEYVLKELREGRLRGRRVAGPDEVAPLPGPPGDLMDAPVDFDAVALEPNSRIAIPAGATAAHYFTPASRAAVNLWHRAAERRCETEAEAELCRVFLSSALPLLRLSDRKASSQWPYWRPRQALTSRNPVPILRKRLAAFREAAAWATTHLQAPADLRAAAAQDLPDLLGARFDLVLTDPPYADQAPYMEYASMSSRLARIDDARTAWSAEIVKTDAPGRREDDAAWLERLSEGFAAAASMVAPGGWLAFFYQDPHLEHWTAVHRAVTGAGLVPLEVVHLPKQRRSMKSVTSPGRTLDGDQLVLCHRPLRDGATAPRPPGRSAGWAEALVAALPEEAPLSNRASTLLRACLLEGWVDELAADHPDLRDLLD